MTSEVEEEEAVVAHEASARLLSRLQEELLCVNPEQGHPFFCPL